MQMTNIKDEYHQGNAPRAHIRIGANLAAIVMGWLIVEFVF